MSLTPARRFSEQADVLVERGDRSKVVFSRARIVGDSLVGVAKALPAVGRASNSDTRSAVALADVRRAYERRLNGTRTTLFVIGSGALVLLVVGGLSTDDGWGFPSSTSCSPYSGGWC